MSILCCCKHEIVPQNSLNVEHEFLKVDPITNIHVVFYNKKPLVELSTIENQSNISNDNPFLAITHQPKQSVQNSMSSFKSNSQVFADRDRVYPKKYHHLFKQFESSKFSIKVIKNSRKSCILLQRKSNKLFGEPSALNSSKILPTLFFVHGVAGNSKTWINQVNYFALKGYEIIIPDIIGHGKSTMSKTSDNYEFKRIASHLLQVFDRYCKRDNVLVGHSYGCLFATYISKMRANMVRKLILISGGSPYPLDYKSPLLNMPLCIIQCLKPCVISHFCCSGFNKISNYCTYADISFNLPMNILQYIMKGQHFLEADLKYHAALSQKVLLIESSNDSLVPLDESLDLFRILRDGYFIMIDGGSHMSILEDPTIINDTIIQFLSMD